MNKKSIITLDIGGTKVNFGRFKNGQIEANKSQLFCADQSVEIILQFLVDGIKAYWQEDVEAIAIGVPTILDIETGVVFDAVNIPAWKNYSLKAALAEHFDCDIYINNDVNCFVAGEVAYGESVKYHQNVVGMCLGTGLGIGIALNNRLHAGHNCSAGELGSIPYLSGTLDNYCSGSFFLNEHGVDGATLAIQARSGDVKAIAIFNEFAQHIAQAIRYLLFVLDPEVIVLGGSASKSFDLFIEPLNQALSDFPFQRVIDNLKIVPSHLDNAALLGAANLYLASNLNSA